MSSLNKKLILIILLALSLRLIALRQYPIGLYSDEAAFGYNAYLLLQTGYDEYGRFWPVSFESFGDWKPPMQAWLAIPFIWLFGLNETAVRLPSAILGTATVGVIYLLAKELFGRTAWRLLTMKQCNNLAIVASLLLAINPWHIFMSRIAMLVAIEVFFVSFGVLGLIKGLKNSKWWIVTVSSFSGAIYSYYGSRITIPLILGTFILVYFNELKNKWRELVIPILIGGILLSPLIIQFIKQPLVVTGRAKTTSVFYNDNIRLQLWAVHTEDGLKGINSFWSRFFHNKIYFYTKDIVTRWLSHYSPIFLFFKGDSHPPFKIPYLGYLHLIDLPFFLIGLLLLIKQIRNKNKTSAFLLLYFLVSPFVAGLTFMTPAANRSFNLVIPWTLITVLGLFRLLTIKQSNNVTMRLTIGIVYLFSLLFYIYSYTVLTPNLLPHHWHYGRKELISKSKPFISKYDTIYMTNKGGPPYIFLSFYLPIKPEDFHATIKRNSVINELGWGHVDKILNVTIPREFEWTSVPKYSRTLYIGFENEIPEDEAEILDRIYYPNGKVAYTIAKLK